MKDKNGTEITPGVSVQVEHKDEMLTKEVTRLTKKRVVIEVDGDEVYFAPDSVDVLNNDDFEGYPPKFLKFLKEKGCLEAFHRNLMASSIEDPLTIFKEEHPRVYISSAFMWSDSPEGFSFWEGRDFHWKQLC